MKAIIRVKKEIDVKYLQVSADVRYWEDAVVNGVEDTDGSLIPFRNGDAWEPLIELETGIIVDWPKGTVASIHYKVCDAGVYSLLDESRKEVYSTQEGNYVPDILCPGEEGYGDYILMIVDENGKINNWEADIESIVGTDDDN